MIDTLQVIEYLKTNKKEFKNFIANLEIGAKVLDEKRNT